jgi:hypothetical protein
MRRSQDTTKLWTKKETYPYFNQSAYNKEWLVEHQTLQGI